MRNVKTAALAAMLLVLPVVASAAEVPGKGVGKLDCIFPIVPHTEWHGRPLGSNRCVAVAARFQDGWCATEFRNGKQHWPWVGPTATRFSALVLNFKQSNGHDGC